MKGRFSMSQKKFDPFRRFDELSSRLYVIFAILALAIHIGICTYTDASPAVVGLILIIVYVAVSLTVTIFPLSVTTA